MSDPRKDTSIGRLTVHYAKSDGCGELHAETCELSSWDGESVCIDLGGGECDDELHIFTVTQLRMMLTYAESVRAHEAQFKDQS